MTRRKPFNQAQSEPASEVLALHFRAIWNSRPPIHELGTIQSGISALMALGKLNREKLAKRLFLSQSQVVNLESRGRPISESTLHRLTYLCRDYRFFDLEVLFEKHIMDSRVRKHRK